MELTCFLFMILTAIAAVILIVRTFDGNPERLEPEYDAQGLEKPLRRFHRPARLTKKDGRILLLFTALYAVLAFTNLGDLRGIRSWHTFEKRGDCVTLELAQPADSPVVRYFSGATVGSFSVELSADGKVWHGKTVEQDYVAVLKWHEFALPDDLAGVRWLRVTARTDDLCLGEIAVTDAAGQRIGFTGETNALTDEQANVPAGESWRNSSYFDEIYHARTAWEHLTGRSPYEITHPPLGKEIIGLGIRIFGMTPFGWRFSGALFGVLMLPVLYILLKLMLGSTMAAACTTIVFALDFMHFTQTRIATIDTYGVFFTLLMYFFFYLYYTQPWDTPLRKTLLPLGLSGLCFGLGAASKWTCIFAGAGLAVLWCIRQVERLRRGRLREEARDYLLPTIGWSCVFFLGLPALLYFVCYIPYGKAAGVPILSADYLKVILDNIKYMYSYHSDLEATHPYQSVWWQWLLDVRPILYYLKDLDGGRKVAFGACGNPLFWWTGLGAMVCMAVKAVRGDRMAWFILAGYLSTLLPWITVERCAFIYHYFPCTVFLALAVGRCLRDCARRSLAGRDRTAAAMAGGCGLLFALFYPALSGVSYAVVYGDAMLRWFAGAWPF